MARKHKIAITIDSDVLGDVDRVAKAEARSRSEIIERAVREHIGVPVEMAKALGNPVVAQAMMEAFGNPDVIRAIAAAMGEKVSKSEVEGVSRAVSKLEDMVVSETRLTKKGRRSR